MKKRKLLLTAFISITVIFQSLANQLNPNLLVTAKLTGSEEVPSVATNALGVASFMLNATQDSMCVTISVTGLSGAITGAHVHEGAPGVVGGIVIDLSPFVNGNIISTTLTGSNLTGINISKFLSGKFYVNVHTAANPNGEIRGQLHLESDWGFSTIMDGSQEVPAVTTSAYGVGAFTLSMDSSMISFLVIVQGLSGTITGAHLHWGAAGVAGTIAVDLSSYVNGNVISGSTNGLTAGLIDSLMKMKIYFNVHTALNPNGEIRGQLLHSERYLYFDAMMDGSQEVPSVSTSAMGVATVRLNSTMDTLWYDIAATGMSGTITSAHFHNAEFGVSGSPVIDITASINGNRLSGTVSGTSLTQTIIRQLLAGEMYINLHTSANPNGEIRGQVYSVARQGYSFTMTGADEVPPVTTAATGSGIVSIDRNNDNLHFMYTASGLTSTGTHFHKAVAGQNGVVILDLGPYYINNGAFGFWRSGDIIPFTTTIAGQFGSDSVYVNIHTAANPNGEIRGQVLNGYQCETVTTGINETTANVNSIEVYPNPGHGIFVLAAAAHSENNQIEVFDVNGKCVFTKRVAGNGNITIDLSSSPSGIYLGKLTHSDGKTRFVKICKY